MAIQNINVSTPDDGLGDKLRDSMVKINANFQEVLTLLDGYASDADLSGAVSTINTSLSNLQTQINGKANINHTHVISDITGLSTALALLTPLTTFNAAIASINGLIVDINNDITNLLTILNGFIGDIDTINDTLEDLQDQIDSISGTTDLSYVASTTGGTVTSSTGTSALIPLAGSNAGLLSPSQKTILDNTSGTNTGNITLTTSGTGASTLVGQALNIPTPDLTAYSLFTDASGNTASGLTGDIYRSGMRLGLSGYSNAFYAGPTPGNPLGVSFGSMGSVINGVTGYHQMVSNYANGTSGPNNIVGIHLSANTSTAGVNFSVAKDLTYVGFGDAGRKLFEFRDGYMSPTAKFAIGTDYLQMHSYATSRVDTGTTTNYLSTDASGVVQSKPITAITAGNSALIAANTSAINTLSAVTTGHTAQIAVLSARTDNDRYITGGTYNSSTKVLALNSNSATTVNITGVTEVSQTITSGNTLTAPSENAVYAAVNEHKESYIINTAYYTGTTGTALRSVFGPTLTSLAVDANTYYEFDAIINTQTASGSNIIQLAFGGTAAYSFFNYNSTLTKGGSYVGTVQYTTYVQTNASSNINSSVGGQYNQIVIKGSFLTTTGGTITPQIGFSLSSTHNLEIGSMFIIRRKGLAANSADAS